MPRAKRAAGAGSVSPRPRKDGRYEARLTLPDGSRRSFYGATWEEAEAKLNAARAELAVGNLPPPARLTVDRFLAEWLASIEPLAKYHTFRSYETIVRRHLCPGIGAEKLATLSTPRVQRLLNDMQRAGYAANTIRQTRIVLATALRAACDWGLLSRNVADAAKSPKVAPTPMPELASADVLTILSAARAERLQAIITVGVSLGMRSAEIRGLRWSDVDLERGSLVVRHQLIIRGKDDKRFEAPKSDAGVRTIRLPAATRAALLAHRDRQAFERAAAGELWQEHDLVFCSRTGAPLWPETVRDLVARVCRRAGVPCLTFHQLRHLCATFLLAQGVSPHMVKELLGHSHVSTTMSIYAHVNEELRQDAADRMDALLAQSDVQNERLDV